MWVKHCARGLREAGQAHRFAVTSTPAPERQREEKTGVRTACRSRIGARVSGDGAQEGGLGRAAAHLIFGSGTGISSTVYGTLVVMATITVGYASQNHPWTLAILVSTTALVLWISHLYAHGLSESIVEHRRLHGWEVAGIARRELG